MLCKALNCAVQCLGNNLVQVDRAKDSMDALVEQCRTRSDCFCDIEHRSRAARGLLGGIQPILKGSQFTGAEEGATIALLTMKRKS